LIRLCTDLGLKEASDYATDLRKLERAQQEATADQQDNRQANGGGTGCNNCHSYYYYLLVYKVFSFFVSFAVRRGSRLSSAASGIGMADTRSQPTSAASSIQTPVGKNFCCASPFS